MRKLHQQVATAIGKKTFVKQVLPAETNIVIFQLDDPFSAPDLVSKLKQQEILGYAIAPNRVRLVLHLDINADMIARTVEVFDKL